MILKVTLLYNLTECLIFPSSIVRNEPRICKFRDETICFDHVTFNKNALQQSIQRGNIGSAEHALTKTELGRRVLYLGQWAISPESDALCNR